MAQPNEPIRWTAEDDAAASAEQAQAMPAVWYVPYLPKVVGIDAYACDMDVLPTTEKLGAFTIAFRPICCLHISQDTQPPLTPKQSARRQPAVQAQILVVEGLLCGNASEESAVLQGKGPGVQGKR